MKENEIKNMSLHELLEYTGSMTDMIEKGSKSVPVCFNHMLERFRISLGLEDKVDLIADISNALDAIK